MYAGMVVIYDKHRRETLYHHVGNPKDAFDHALANAENRLSDLRRFYENPRFNYIFAVVRKIDPKYAYDYLKDPWYHIYPDSLFSRSK
jgi:hypothetical protein